MNGNRFGRNIRVAITPNCNMNCIYCEGNKGFHKANRVAAMEDFRRTPLSNGNITTTELIDILKVFVKVGFDGVTFTGGEPLMNKEWDKIVNEAARIGFSGREITTNGVLLGDYFISHGKLPDLTMIKTSFDTDDKEEFNRITGGDFFDKVVDSVKIISKHCETRANKVVLRDTLKTLNRFLVFCREIGFTSATLFELCAYPNRSWTEEDREFYKNQFVSCAETVEELRKVEDLALSNHKYGHISVCEDGFKIMTVDSDLTTRDSQCENCPIDCQHGKFTVRVATDGNITMCPDYRTELVSINGLEALENNTLEEKLKKMFEVLNRGDKPGHLKTFQKKYDLLK